jgi:hypothetical protein
MSWNSRPTTTPGKLRNAVGPYIFIAEIPADRQPRTQIVLKMTDVDAFLPDPVVEVVTPFENTHYRTAEMTVRDPDGRLWNLQAPSQPDDEGERHGA